MIFPQPNAWNYRRWPYPFPAAYKLGIYTGQRKVTSRAFLPGPLERMAIGQPVEPYWHVVNFAPESRDSGDGEVVPTGSLAYMALMASTDQAAPAGQNASFDAHLYQVAGEKSGHRWQRTLVNAPNFFGTAQQPFYLRKPYYAPNRMPLLVRVSNRTTVTNNIQVVVFGLRRRRPFPSTQAVAAYHQFPRLVTAEMALQLALAAESRILQPTDIVAVQKPPWIDPTAGSQPFRRQASVALPAIGAEATVVTFPVPAGKFGMIFRLANQFNAAGWTEGTGHLTWRLEIDGVPVPGYHNILASMGSMSNPADLEKEPIRIREGQTVALICANVAPGVGVSGQFLLGLLAGYFYPLSAETQSTWL